jgi:hypothetical protein
LAIMIKRFINLSSTACYTLLLILLIVLFIIAYKKQLNYIHKRIENIKYKNKQEKDS